MERGTQKTVLVLTVAYFFVELAGGIYYHSLALVTDASFMSINIGGQMLAFYVARLAQRMPNGHKTFGYERAKVLSGLLNGMLVGFLLFYVFVDAYYKIRNPQPLDADKILLIALAGLLVNVFGVLEFRGHSSDMNLRGAFLLIFNDMMGSVGVIVSSVIIRYTHLYFVDPLAGICIGLFIAYPTYFLVKDSVHILMEGNPARIEVSDVANSIYANFDSVTSVKDMHIWGLSPEKIILAVRVRTNGHVYARDTMKMMKQLLKTKYGFSDIYIELYEEKGAG